MLFRRRLDVRRDDPRAVAESANPEVNQSRSELALLSTDTANDSFLLHPR